MRKIKYSLIIPIYNSEKSLNSLLSSLLLDIQLKQLNQIEIICVNDGSSDASEKILQRYAQQEKNIIRLVSIENQGPSYARNLGLRMAKGEYILFCDADDRMDLTIIQKLDQMEEEFDLLISDYMVYEESMPRLITATENNERILNQEDLLNLYNDRLINAIWNKVYKKEIITKHKIYFDENLQLGEDLIFNLDYLKVSKKVYYLDDYFYHYQHHEENTVSRLWRQDYYEIQLLLLSNLLDYFQVSEVKQEVIYNTFVRNVTKYLYQLGQRSSYKEFKAVVSEKLYSETSWEIIDQMNRREMNFQQQLIHRMIIKQNYFGLYLIFKRLHHWAKV